MAEMFRELDVDVAERVLFKIPCTWEGVQAVETLEREGVKCHVTQVYSPEQAARGARGRQPRADGRRARARGTRAPHRGGAQPFGRRVGRWDASPSKLLR